MFNWLKKPEVKQVAEKPKKRKSLFSTHEFDAADHEKETYKLLDKLEQIKREQPIFRNSDGKFAFDDSSDGFPSFKLYDAGTNSLSDSVVYWYGSQGFIGAQLCGILAQNWLVNKACAMPGDDAIRKGYSVVSADGEELDPEAMKIIKEYDRRMKLNFNMREFIRKGRIFGIRIAMFKVMSTDPDYYEKPFNIDGVTANSYKGIVQVDPYWTAPMLDGASASQPDTLHFYEPTWWIINGKKIHRSHLIIFRHAEPVDVLKPQYLYGGVPLTQQIMERVYAAERTSNEAPQLAMSKRTTVWLTDMEAVMGDTNAAVSRLQQWVQYRDNYGIKMGDKEGDEFQQFDTSLADFDALIMTQYQLVSAIAGVPSTKLIGTAPKGFNSTGEYEEASYHELLESIQTHDLTPLAERHHALVIKSFVEPALKKKLNLETTLNWLPLDTPTAQELAQTNLAKAQTGQVLVESGALSSEDERQRLATDKTSGYNELGILENDLDLDEDELLDNEVKKESEEELGNQVPKTDKAEDAADAKWEESKHPRAKNGQFGSGGTGASAKSESEKSGKSESGEKSESKSESAQGEQPSGEKEKSSAKSKKYSFHKVKELANGGYIDQHGFEHSPNLNEKERAIEDGFYREILKNTPKLIADYKKEFGNTIDPDSVKKLDPNFAKDPSLAGAVHEPSSYLSKIIWKNALEQKKSSGDKSPVLFTAGGSGSGKSEAMGLAKKLLGVSGDPLTFDSVLGNFDKSTQKIQEALDGQDGKVDIVYTNAPLELAVQLNLQRPRTVKLDTQINAHFQASENIRKLSEHYKDNPRVNIKVVNNDSDPTNLTEGKLSDVHDYSDRNAVRQRLVNHAEKLVRKNLLKTHEGKTLKDQKSKLRMLLG